MLRFTLGRVRRLPVRDLLAAALRRGAALRVDLRAPPCEVNLDLETVDITNMFSRKKLKISETN
jgi:hypothetical protein